MTTTRRNRIGAASFLLLAANAVVCSADNLHVPGQYSTIQCAIDASSDGDNVIVAPGRYHELIDFKGKAITLRSVLPAVPQIVEATIIDGAGAGPVVRCVSGEGPNAVISGITITGGRALRGAGMSNDGASPTVTRCRFVGNVAEVEGGGMSNVNGSNPHIQDCSFIENSAGVYGGGMFNDQSSPWISGSTFENNTAITALEILGRASTPSQFVLQRIAEDGDPPPRGGGIFNVESCPTLTDCMFTGNTATHGGGIAFYDESHSIVAHCTFAENSAAEHGGGIIVYRSDPKLTDCTLLENSARFGGGMSISGNSSDTFVSRCTFDANTAGLRGGGLHISGLWLGPTIVNSIFKGNCSEDDGGGIYTYAHTMFINTTFSGNVAAGLGGGILVALSTTTLANCILWGNVPSELRAIGSYAFLDVEHSNVQGGFEGIGNTNQEPHFVDVLKGDLRLGPGSPCIDAGNNAAVPTNVQLDFYGNPRFVDDPDTIDTGSGVAPIVDMGAYEFSPSCPADIFPPPNGNGFVGLGDLLYVVFHWGTPIGDINGDGTTNVADVLIVLTSWGTCS